MKRVESLATKQEVKSRAASFRWRSASSFSSSTWNLLVPEMFRVPPAPEPCLCSVSLATQAMIRFDFNRLELINGIGANWKESFFYIICIILFLN